MACALLKRAILLIFNIVAIIISDTVLLSNREVEKMSFTGLIFIIPALTFAFSLGSFGLALLTAGPLKLIIHI